MFLLDVFRLSFFSVAEVVVVVVVDHDDDGIHCMACVSVRAATRWLYYGFCVIFIDADGFRFFFFFLILMVEFERGIPTARE